MLGIRLVTEQREALMGRFELYTDGEGELGIVYDSLVAKDGHENLLAIFGKETTPFNSEDWIPDLRPGRTVVTGYRTDDESMSRIIGTPITEATELNGRHVLVPYSYPNREIDNQYPVVIVNSTGGIEFLVPPNEFTNYISNEDYLLLEESFTFWGSGGTENQIQYFLGRSRTVTRRSSVRVLESHLRSEIPSSAGIRDIEVLTSALREPNSDHVFVVPGGILLKEDGEYWLLYPNGEERNIDLNEALGLLRG
jgi:hypothetical protein